MKVIRSRIIPFKGFAAINFFGVVFLREDVRGNLNISRGDYDRLLRHEYTHTKQMRELGYLFFYIWYLVEWGIKLVIYRNRLKAYRNISFEREAYTHQMSIHYNQSRPAYAFLKYLRR